MIIPLEPFRFFSKILGDIRSSRCTTSVLDTGGKWKKTSIRKIVTLVWTPLGSRVSILKIFSFKFSLSCQRSDIVPTVCHRCRWHQWQFIYHRCRWHRWQICRRYRWHRWQVCHRYQQHQRNLWQNCRWCHWYRWQTCHWCRYYRLQFCRRCRWYRCNFATSVVDTGGAPRLANISANFQKIWNGPRVIFRGLGEEDSWKKSEAKNLVPLSFRKRGLQELCFGMFLLGSWPFFSLRITVYSIFFKREIYNLHARTEKWLLYIC